MNFEDFFLELKDSCSCQWYRDVLDLVEGELRFAFEEVHQLAREEAKKNTKILQELRLNPLS